MTAERLAMNPWMIVFVVVIAALAWLLLKPSKPDPAAGVQFGPEPADTVPNEDREQPQDGGPRPTLPK